MNKTRVFIALLCMCLVSCSFFGCTEQNIEKNNDLQAEAENETQEETEDYFPSAIYAELFCDYEVKPVEQVNIAEKETTLLVGFIDENKKQINLYYKDTEKYAFSVPSEIMSGFLATDLNKIEQTEKLNIDFYAARFENTIYTYAATHPAFYQCRVNLARSEDNGVTWQIINEHIKPSSLVQDIGFVSEKEHYIKVMIAKSGEDDFYIMTFNGGLSFQSFSGEKPEFLNMEQYLLYCKAAKFTPVFYGNAYYLNEFKAHQDEQTSITLATVQLDGYNFRHFKVDGIYGDYERFCEFGNSIYTQDYFKKISSGFVNIDGNTFAPDTAKGQIMGYVPDYYADTYELISESENEVSFYRICHYFNSYAEAPQTEPIESEKLRITITFDGENYRISEFEMPK